MSKSSWFLIGVIILLASILRFWKLDAIDIVPDEYHYINDAFRLLNKDPYISIRHHPFMHPGPSIGHPFLQQIFTVLIFKIVGVSNFTARFLPAISGVVIVLLLLLLVKGFGKKVTILGMLLLAISPFAVRFSKDARLDSFFTFIFTLAAVSVWRYFSTNKFYWLFLAGIACGMAISTKLNGILILGFVLTLLIFKTTNLKKILTLGQVRIVLTEFTAVIIPTLFIGIVLNDPGAYLDGILRPSSGGYSFLSKELWLRVLGSFNFYSKVALNLLSPTVLVIWLFALVFLLREQGFKKRFLFIWLFFTLILVVFHQPGISNEHGLTPAVPPIILVVAYFLSKIKISPKLILLLIISVLPYTIWYGLYLKPVPYYEPSYYANKTIGDDFYYSIIKRVNELTPASGKVYLLSQLNYPYSSLRPDISWNYSDLDNSDVLVVSEVNLVGQKRNNIRFIESRIGEQDGEKIIRYIFIRENEYKN